MTAPYSTEFKQTRTGSLIDPRNYEGGENWYRHGNRVAFWDRYTKHWICYDIDAAGHQQGCADLYPNAGSLLACE